MSKHDALYIEKFQPREGEVDIPASETYLLVRGSDIQPKSGYRISGYDFSDDGILDTNR